MPILAEHSIWPDFSANQLEALKLSAFLKDLKIKHFENINSFEYFKTTHLKDYLKKKFFKIISRSFLLFVSKFGVNGQLFPRPMVLVNLPPRAKREVQGIYLKL